MRRHPDLVRRLVFAGGAGCAPDGFYPEVLGGMKQMRPEDLVRTPFHEAYTRTAPNPEQWPALVARLTELFRNWKGLAPEEVRSIKAPTLLVIGDAEVVRPEHTVEMFRLLGGGVPGDLVGLPRSRVAVLPGTTHVTLVHRADWCL